MTLGTDRRIPPLRAGRRAAGAALLGWLDDPRAPRLCRITGSAGAGKSHLLAWLVAGGTAPDTPSAQRISAVLPADGLSVRGAVWLLGLQLGTGARTPQELLAALAADGRRTVVCVPDLDRAADPARLIAELLDPILQVPQVRMVVESASPLAAVADPAVLDLDDPHWTDRERFEEWCAREGADPSAYPNPGRALGVRPPEDAGLSELIARVPLDPAGDLDLPAAGEDLLTELWTAAAREDDLGPLAADPLLYALARPAAVTAALEGRTGALPEAWEAAGPALIDTPDAPSRAHVLRARLLGARGASPADAAAVDRLADAPSGWSARWARWEPGTAAAAASGTGPHRDGWLLADATGAVRVLSAATGATLARIVVPGPKPLRALAATAGGSLLLLDSWGGIELVAPAHPAPGLEPYALDEALARLRAAAGAEPSALAAATALPDAAPALGDTAGAVHWYQDGEVWSERLHTGPVTALAALGLGPAGDAGVPLLASGGFDGAVRLWGPGGEPMADPADHRPSPVAAVALGDGPAGLVVAAAWSDGLIRVRRPEQPGSRLDLRLGSQVWALSLVGGTLLAGLADGVVAIDLRQN
ncbi:WD40 repeat domain-containing protein [Kitasatospora paracochleata]|uniref:WD40 repeat protein n=1 Tax=Kitasatospora paracochleata TaxID=58354 RepID=A0ABT1J7G6_9ACTN|nr:hypothetical protein [Kitasatospora paracochleata]MCP2313094.1 hypothetical protein [Kitasatospora paracochleata]